MQANVLSKSAQSFAVSQALLALRFFVGVGLGGAHVPIALYMEYVPTKYRGVMLVALQSFWTLGTMIEVTPWSEHCLLMRCHLSLARPQDSQA